MDKNLQDFDWACLPKETREKMKEQYSMRSTDNWDNGFDACLVHYFGLHNLTSKTEPEEMLCCNRKEVLERYELNENILSTDPTNNIALGIKSVLFGLFGDKCLPDKEQLILHTLNILNIVRVKRLLSRERFMKLKATEAVTGISLLEAA